MSDKDNNNNSDFTMANKDSSVEPFTSITINGGEQTNQSPSLFWNEPTLQTTPPNDNVHNLMANLSIGSNDPLLPASMSSSFDEFPTHLIECGDKDNYPFLKKIYQKLLAHPDFISCAFFDVDHSSVVNLKQLANSKTVLYNLIIRQLLFDGYGSVAELLQSKIDPTIPALSLSPEATLHKLFSIIHYIEIQGQTDAKFSSILNWFLSLDLKTDQMAQSAPTPGARSVNDNPASAGPARTVATPFSNLEINQSSGNQFSEAASYVPTEASSVIYETDAEYGHLQSLPIHGASIGPARPLQVAYKFGQIGNGIGCLDTPHGFCLGIDNDIVVADTNNHRICVFTLQGHFKFSFGEYGIENGQLHQPRKIAMMPPAILPGHDQYDPVFIVCDRGTKRSRMQVFSVKGEFIRLIDIPSMDIVSGLTTTQDRKIVAVDSVRSGVLMMDEFGALLRWFTCAPYMMEPSDVAIHNKHYYICDFKGHCVCIFNQHGILVNRLSAKMLKFPNGIDVSDFGDIICGDSHGNRFHISVFNEQGQLVGDYDCPFVKVSRCCGLRLSQEGLIVTLAKNNHHAVVMNAITIKTPMNQN